jgi:predicted metalloprotease with PDZ domain
MRRHQSIVAAIVLMLTAASLAAKPYADDTQRCTAPAKECEQQIREMLVGKTYLGVKLTESRWGIVVKSVVQDSPAALAGLRAGDRIFAINGRDASKADITEFKKMLSTAKGSGKVSLNVVRAGTVIRIYARLEQMSKEQIDKVVENHLREAHQSGEPQSAGNHR